MRGFIRGCARAVLGPAAAVRVRGAAAERELLVPRRLRGSGEAEHRDDLPATGVQDQVPGQLLPAAGQPRVRLHQPDLRVLRRVQAALQRPPLAPLHRLLQLPAGGGAHRRQDPVHARGAVAGPAGDGADQGDRAAGGCAGPGTALRSAVVRSGPGDQGVGGERPGRVLHFWGRQGGRVLEEAQSRSHLPGSSSKFPFPRPMQWLLPFSFHSM